jgi:Ca-activated chloride channel family protein
LRADARGGVARVVLEQRFENVYDEPLHVTYLMPLPQDGAVSGYAFTMGARRVVGEVDKKKVARERFERALASGQTAGLVEQERASLFTQELGNVPPKSTIVAELTIDQRLTWLDEGAWEWRFPTVAGPRYVGAAGRVDDARRTEVAVADAPLPVRLSLALAIRDLLPEGTRPESPLQALHVSAQPGRTEVGLSDEGGARLDRDMVVRWRASTPRVGLSVDAGRPARGASADAAYGLVSIVPPVAGSELARPRRRDLILLLDTSGSMGGEPLDQSRRVCLALIDTLGDDDHLEMIEFSTAARRWKKSAVPATASHKQAARDWLNQLTAGGGTEMVHGLLEALAPLSAEAQRQVVLLTDGYIGFEAQVVKSVCEQLPAGSRLHVGRRGSAVNRSLTDRRHAPAAASRSSSRPGEDPERPVRRLLARTASPFITDVEIDGEALLGCAPARLPDLYAGAPAVCAVKLRAEGGTLRVRGPQRHPAAGKSACRCRPARPARAPGGGGALRPRDRRGSRAQARGWRPGGPSWTR